MNSKKVFLILLGILLFILTLNSPQGMVLPLWVLVYLLKDKLIKILDKYPLTITFFLLGTFLGLLTEFFAILQNIDIVSGERILLSQNLITDILLAPAYYVPFILIIFFLVKKYNFSKTSIFLISGIYGIFTENGGTIFIGIFTNPLLGIPMSFLVMSVYAIFPLLTYLLTEHRFDPNRPNPNWKTYLLLPVIFFFLWAIFGNLILPAFKLVFGS